jgi:hypothetical protein
VPSTDDIPVVYWKYRDPREKYPDEPTPIYDQLLAKKQAEERMRFPLITLPGEAESPAVERFRAQMRLIQRDPGQARGPWHPDERTQQ